MTKVPFEELIERKRDGKTHTGEEMQRIVLEFAKGDVPDYQMSAWLMAAVLNGLDDDETMFMTQAMIDSGVRMDLSSIPGVKVDKHSTGGVADTTTLALVPLVAACGVPIAKMSGRGLGHTGGTLDKLEAIPGFKVELSPEAFIAQVRSIGAAVIAQSPEIDPADKKIYALRDVTGTVPSIPLIVSSIISKKAAGGADAVVLDVKVGSGAFMKDEKQAAELARQLVRVGHKVGLRVDAIMTDMDQPLGNAIGNALEIREAVQVLRGECPAALKEVVFELGRRMLVLGDKAESPEEADALLLQALESGAAERKFREWITAQGGDARIVDDPALLPRSACSRVFRAVAGGYIGSFDTEGIGKAAARLGAGREKAGDTIDYSAGIQLLRRVGDEVSIDDPIAVLHAEANYLLDLGQEIFAAALKMSPVPVERKPVIREVDIASAGE